MIISNKVEGHKAKLVFDYDNLKIIHGSFL